MRRSRVKLAWASMAQLREQQFLRLLDTAAGQRTFTESFFDKLRARKSEVDRAMWKLFAFNLALVSILFINAFVLPTGLSISGLSTSEVGKIKELVLFVSATLSFIISTMYMDSAFMKSMGKTWLLKRDGPEGAKFSQALFGDVLYELHDIEAPAPKFHFKTAGHKFLGAALLVFFVIYVLGFVGTYLAVHAVILADVISKPSLPYYLSWFVIVYAASAYLTPILLQLLTYLPLPYKDYSVAAELIELAKRKVVQ